MKKVQAVERVPDVLTLIPLLALSSNRVGVRAEEVLGVSADEGLARECQATERTVGL